MKSAGLWIIVTLLVAQSINASLNTLPGEELSSQERGGPLFETGARSNHSGSTSGQLNVDQVNTSYNAGDTVHAIFNATHLTNGTQYNLLFILYDSSQNSVSGYGFNNTWNASSPNLGIGASMVNLTNGSYCIVAFLSVYDSSNSTFALLDNVTVCFGVGTYSQTTGCGYQATYQTLHVYTASSIDHGDTLSGSIITSCDLIDASMYVSLSVTNSGGTTIASSSLMWTGTGNGTNDVWNVSNLGLGSYTLTASLLYRTGSSGPYSSGGSTSSNFTVLPSGTVSISGLNSNYSAGTVIQATIIESNLDSGITYGEHWHVTNSNGYTLSGYGGNQTWNSTGNNNSFAISLANLSNGTYCITASLYTVDSTGALTVLDTSTMCFTIGTVSTPNTGCGYDVNQTMLMAYASVQMYEGDEFVSWISTYCDLINTSMWIHAYIYDESQTVVANTSMFWTPTTSTGISDNWNVSGLTAGNYTFSATLYAYPGSSVTVETDTVNFTVYPVNNNSDCGYDSNLTAIYAYSWQSIFNIGNMFESTINSYCNLLGSDTMIEWTVYYPSNGTIVAHGNTSWYVNSTSNSLTVNHAGFDEGNYAFLAKLSVWDNLGATSGWSFVTDSVYNFSYVASNGNLSSGELDIDTNNETYAMGDELSASFSSTALVIGEMYYLDWGLYDASQSMVDGGNSTWMAYTNTSIEWQNYTVDGAPIDYGTYCFYGNLFHLDANYSATWLYQDDTCITVENPGSNNTGGNNTGGNNTTDSDGDGVEDVLDAFPTDPTEWSDYDNDGVGDNSDNCYWYSNPNQANWDNDSFGDICDWDDDNDNVNDTEDAFPYDPSEWSDSDSDGVGDNGDNCPSVANTDQSDVNNNGIGDACDTNTDGNGNNTVINIPPVISGVTISPNMPQSDDNLTCMYTTFDADGDTVTTTVVWKVNGNTIASGTNTLSSGYAVGDEVQCVVSGSDGQAPGNTDSDTVTILPTVSDVDNGAGNGLPALGSVGTLLAIAIGVGLTRRGEE
jgi:hypothetical protein